MQRIIYLVVGIVLGTRPTAYAAPGRAQASAPSSAAPAATLSPAHPLVQPTKSFEQVEEVEEVEVETSAPAHAPAGGPQDTGPKEAAQRERLKPQVLFGHLHAAFVHMPIAWALLWALFEAAIYLGHQRALTPAARCVAWLTCLSFAPAMLSGLQRFGELLQISQDSSTQVVGAWHRNLNYAACILAVGLTCVRHLNLAEGSRPVRLIYVACVCGLLGLLGYSAHLGGTMVYGEDFLSL